MLSESEICRYETLSSFTENSKFLKNASALVPESKASVPSDVLALFDAQASKRDLQPIGLNISALESMVQYVGSSDKWTKGVAVLAVEALDYNRSGGKLERMTLDPSLYACMIMEKGGRKRARGSNVSSSLLPVGPLEALVPFQETLQATYLGRGGQVVGGGARKLAESFTSRSNCLPGKPRVPFPEKVTYPHVCSAGCDKCMPMKRNWRRARLMNLFQKLSLLNTKGVAAAIVTAELFFVFENVVDNVPRANFYLLADATGKSGRRKPEQQFHVFKRSIPNNGVLKGLAGACRFEGVLIQRQYEKYKVPFRPPPARRRGEGGVDSVAGAGGHRSARRTGEPGEPGGSIPAMA